MSDEEAGMVEIRLEHLCLRKMTLLVDLAFERRSSARVPKNDGSALCDALRPDWPAIATTTLAA